MKIETGFNLGDKVYYVYNFSIRSSRVEEIIVNVVKSSCNNLKVSYRLSDFADKTFKESYLFETKEDLIKSLTQ
jgi:hypothetical protein